ncbi:MAG: flagellar hook-basal body complex protein [Candidatus Sericytochromatia bacterium]|nr:flagellar hook-basal body complex protein [Candidatus Sericytochromatia bacterium]
MGDIRLTGVNSIQSMDQWLKVLAGNLTGSNVTGYKQQRVEFADVLSAQMYGAAGVTTNAAALPAMSMPMGGNRIRAIKTDFSQGLLAESTRETDLGINGEGFFILSKSLEPSKIDELVFTRDGSFRLDYVSKGNGEGDFYLVNQEGYYVLGMEGNKNAYQPGANNLPGFAKDPVAGSVKYDRISGSSFVVPDPVSGADALYGIKPIKVFQKVSGNTGTERNPAISDETIKFDERGGLLVNGDVTTNDKGEPAPIFVALAKFQSREGLARTSSGSLFAWSTAAGDDVVIGSAGSKNLNDTDVGFDGTQVLGRRLEASNSSVNTTLPEMTIAQKSFTASVKIIQVGNALIDDVNNLVR